MEKYRLGNWLVDPSTGTLSQGNKQKHIEAKCMDLLVLLIKAEGNTVTRDTIMEQIWGGRFVTDFALNNTVALLRKHLSDDQHNSSTYIKTRHKRGYYLDVMPSIVKSEVEQETVSKQSEKNNLKTIAVSSVSVLLIIIVSLYIFGNWNKNDDLTAIVVLPFASSSNEKVVVDFSDGLVEEITHQLANETHLQTLTHRNESLENASKNQVIDLAGKLNTDYLVDGSIRHHGDISKVTIRLIDGVDGSQLLSQSYIIKNNIPLIEQTRVAESITESIANVFAENASLETIRENAIPREAYLHLLSARKLNSSGSIEGYRAGIDEYKMAVLLAPDYVDAHAELALNFLVLAQRIRSNQDAFNKNARKSIDAALKIDDMHSTAIAAAAMYYQNTRDFEKAAEFYELAISLEPNSYVALLNYGNMLRQQHDYLPSLKLYEKALDIAPRSAPANWAVGNILTNQGLIDNAIAQFESCLLQLPEHTNCVLGLAYAQRLANLNVESDTTLTEYEQSLDTSNYWVKDALAWQYFRRGEPEKALSIYDELISQHGSDLPDKFTFVFALWQLGTLDSPENAAFLNDGFIESPRELVNYYYLAGQCEKAVSLSNDLQRSASYQKETINDALNGLSASAQIAFCALRTGRTELAKVFVDELSSTLSSIPENGVKIAGQLYIQAQFKALQQESFSKELASLEEMNWPLIWMVERDPILSQSMSLD